MPGRLFAMLATLVLLALPNGGCDGDPPPPPPAPPRVQAPDAEALHAAGTGALGPLLLRLSLLWAERGGLPRVVVEESIGSTGGIRAAAEGAVDLGLVSRPLTPDERLLGLVTVPLGRDAVVLAAHAGVRIAGVTSAELRALHAGTAHRFADGTPATLLLRDAQESGNGALERAVPGLALLREQAYRERRLRVLYHDSAMLTALAATPGSLGISSLSLVRACGLPLKVLELDGVRPSPEAVVSGSWRATRELAIVARPDRIGRARPFLAFVLSPAGRQAAEEAGYVSYGAAAPGEGLP